jgi:membrane protease YdiL (CAAX protease family)
VLRRILAGAAIALALTATAVSAWRVDWIHGREAFASDGPASLSERAEAGSREVELVGADLRAGTYARFELCSQDPMAPDVWAGALAAILGQGGAEGMDIPIDRDLLDRRARRSEDRSCLRLLSGPVEQSDRYTVGLRWEGQAPPEDLADVPLTLRIAAAPRTGAFELYAVGTAWLGMLLLATSLALRRGPDRATRAAPLAGALAVGLVGLALSRLLPTPGPALVLFGTTLCIVLLLLVGPAPREPAIAPEAPRPASDPLEAEAAALRSRGPGLRVERFAPEARVGVAIALGALALYLTRHLSLGALTPMVAGLGLAGLEVFLAFLLIGDGSFRRRLDALALTAPRDPRALFMVLAAVCGVVLAVQAVVAPTLVPSTGRSPVQMLISSPSGLLGFTALGVMAPVAEEVFFRGLIYGLLAKRSWILAFVASAGLFAVAHGEQSFGQWGTLTGIALTGCVLTALRARTGSVTVPALAHLTYNGILAIPSLL